MIKKRGTFENTNFGEQKNNTELALKRLLIFRIFVFCGGRGQTRKSANWNTVHESIKLPPQSAMVMARPNG
jgi:hypothetical protein